MKLNLERPLLVFDLETTGLNVSKDRIVEISLLKITPPDEQIVKTMLINPQIHIPKECSELHGIYDKDVVDKPIFAEVADEILEFIGDSDLAGYNCNKFDIPLLMEELLRCGKELDLSIRYTVDVQNIFHKMEPRTLSAAYKFYCNKELVDAHEAESDVRATFAVLLGQLERYDGMAYQNKKPNETLPITGNVRALSRLSESNRTVDSAGHIIFNENGEEVFNFGKYKGQSAEKILATDPYYYDWMMGADFPLYTKKIIAEIKQRTINGKNL